MIGQSLGRYHILEQLGEGGMAIVYKAYDTRLETDVAVKVIRTENILPSVLERALKRFEREAKALAKLNHPNIVKVIDYGEYEGKPYLVMPYFPSGTLKQKLGKPMPWGEALQILLPIAEALDYAHSQNMVHRDVKPSNILLTERGQPMLTDFGIAKVLDIEETMDLTGTSAAVGTPEYMAPEQATAKTADHRADIYALGIVLYEMVTGRKPYQADTPMAVMIMHARDPLPRPSQYVPGLPERVEKVLLNALAKNPADRYQSMAGMGNALEEPTGGTPEQKPSKRIVEPVLREKPKKAPKAKVSRSISKWVWWALLGVVGVGLVGGVFNWISSDGLAQLFPTPTKTSTVTPAYTNTPAASSTPKATSTPAVTATPELGIGSSWERSADGMVMMYVPAGEFEMGSEDGYDNEKPVHTVYLDAFWLDQTEVTNAMYAQCEDAGVCDAPSSIKSYTNDSYYGNAEFDNHPVIYVSRGNATAYCEWAEGRLPSEAEWEKAARGTDKRMYPWGDVIDETYANYGFNLSDTTAVGNYEKGKSAYGAYDMAGNVYEWTSSLDLPYPYEADDGRENFSAEGDRVLRGGAYLITGDDVRASTRGFFDPSFTLYFIGFRCARSP